MSRSTSNDMPSALRAVCMDIFATPGKILEFEASASCANALANLRAVGVSGAPVYDKPASGVRLYRGFVDLADLAMVTLSKGLMRTSPKGVLEKLGAALLPDSEHEVIHAVNVSGSDPFAALPISCSALQAAKIMTTKSLRRMALVDDAIDVDSALSSTGSKASGHAVTLVGILTPMDILHAIHDNLSTLGHLGGLPIAVLFPLGSPHTIAPLTPLSAAILDLRIRGSSSVPVVEPSGRLLSSFSLSQCVSFAGMSEESIEAALGRSVEDFLAHQTPEGKSTGSPPCPLTAMPTDSLSTVIQVMYEAMAHDIIVVNSARVPVGVISVRDVIEVAIASHVVLYGHQDTEHAPAAATGGGSGSASVSSPSAAFVPGSGLTALLQKTTAGAFLEALAATVGSKDDFMVASVDEEMPLTKVVSMMRDYDLHTAPVYRMEPGAISPDDRQYFGWISGLDVVTVREAKGIKDTHKHGFMSLFRSASDDTEHFARAVANASLCDPFYAVNADVALSQLLAIMGGRALESVAVMDTGPHPRVQGLISRHHITRFLFDCREELGGLAALPVSSLLAATTHKGPVEAIPSDATVRAAVHALASCGSRPLLPVIDKATRVLISTLSIADTHSIAVAETDRDMSDALSLSLLTWLEGRESPDPPTIRTHDTLSTVLELLVASGAKGAHVVDDGGVWLGTVTEHDIICAVRPPTGGL